MDQFFAYDTLLYNLYATTDFDDMQRRLLSDLENLISFDYASILMLGPADESTGRPQVTDVFCQPGSFAQAEEKALSRHPENLTKKLSLTTEAAVVRLSSVESEEERLHTPVYQDCYKDYNIYDILQLSVKYEKKQLAILSLFRTRDHGAFEDRDVYLLKTLSKHLNLVFYRHDRPVGSGLSVNRAVSEITARVHMTPKETEILTQIFLAKSNTEICDALHIKEHTLQKHFQNIYRKLNISSKWELLRFAFQVSSASEQKNPEEEKKA